jgi:hypothetical protein
VCSLWLSFILLFEAPGLSGQSNPVKVCVSQEAEGYDALRLARELSSRKLESGASLTVVAITGKALSAEDEQVLGLTPGTPFARVVFTEKTAKARTAQLEQLGCGYSIKVWYHERVDIFNPDSSPAPGTPVGDRTRVGYELRKTGNNRVLVRASLPPLTVYVKQGRRVFNPYPLFANEIVKTLDRVSVRSTGR